MLEAHLLGAGSIWIAELGAVAAVPAGRRRYFRLGMPIGEGAGADVLALLAPRGRRW